MKIENQVCSLEQSKRLLGLGIEGNSFFMWHIGGVTGEWIVIDSVHSNITNEDFPAFTLSELGQMLNSETYTQRTGSEDSEYANWEWINDGNETGSGLFGYEVWARADMLIACLENGSLSSENCNKRLVA